MPNVLNQQPLIIDTAHATNIVQSGQCTVRGIIFTPNAANDVATITDGAGNVKWSWKAAAATSVESLQKFVVRDMRVTALPSGGILRIYMEE